MRNYTQTQALSQIFDNPAKPLSNKMFVYKHRWKNKTLSQSSINDILEEHGYIVAREPLFKKKSHRRRYHNIQKAKYITIHIDVKTYNRVSRVITVGDGGTSDIEVSKWFEKRLNKPNDFVRLKCMDYYIDIKINSFRSKEETLLGRIHKTFIISLGCVIDSNNLSRIIVKAA